MLPATVLDHIPTEIWGQIAQALPATSLPSFVLSHRKFHESANSYLYRTVYFYCTTYHYTDGTKAAPSQDPCFGVHRAQSWLSHPDRSSQIIKLDAFLRTITENAQLRFHIIGASFGWAETATAQEILVTKRCLENLRGSLRLLHVSLPHFDAEFAMTSNVTFLEIEYPSLKSIDYDLNNSQYDVHLHQDLRDKLHSIFCIPTLRHLLLNNTRTFQAFKPLLPSQTWRVGTSSVISLSLPNTVPLSRDLKEMLTWPNALRKFYHQSAVGLHGYFQDYDHELLTSPQVFIQGLYSQRHTIEELVYNNAEDRRGHDGTTFGKALREFIYLRRLAVPRECLIEEWEDEALPLYKTLPPNLEEAWIMLGNEDVYDETDRSYIIQGLRGIAMNKEQWFPSLKTLVLWGSGIYDHSGVQAEPDKILEALYVSFFRKLPGCVC